MRWNLNIEMVGHVRIGCAFLFFPKCINGKCRWLEFARWEEVDGINHEGCKFTGLRWIND